MNFIFYSMLFYSTFSWGLTTDQVNLEDTNTDNHFVQIFLNEASICGGAVVSKNHIITAGHCIFNGNPEDYLVKINHQSFSVKKLIVHEDYSVFRPQFFFDGEYFSSDQGAYFDIGLIELENKIPQNLYESKKVNLVNKNLNYNFFTIYVGGWGSINSKGDAPSTIRLTDQAFVIEKNIDPNLLKRELYGPVPGPGQRSFDHYRFWQNSSHLYIDFKDDETQVCKGDSGSPIFAVNEHKTFLIGLISSSVDWRCGRHKSNALFATDVYYNFDWIKENTN